ncbi:MAG: protein kinase, partial [Gemmatimonadales bacterium]
MNTPNSRLVAALAGRYTIEREVGEGGMATVYLAQDVRHDRKVALKVLRPELAAVIGAERFLAEIKTTASLQHPHILPLHDSGEADGTVFYVMPYVEGESLRDRLGREKQLPVEEAVRIAREVASALDYAHRRKVIHRDIKPENIMLLDGQAMVADFGIALAVSTAGASRMTETGMSLGTPQYMSPEQAMGERDVSPTSDVYALGCVLYEMLAGEPPFTGPTAQAIVARVLTDTPRPLRAQRHTIPANVEAAVSKALEKLPADRFGAAADFSAALGDPAFRLAGAESAREAIRATAARSTDAAYLLAGLVLVLGTLAAWGWMRAAPAGRVSRYSIVLPAGVDMYTATTDVPAVSPDGRRFVYGGSDTRLVLREDNDLRSPPIPGSENAWAPEFSPDGASIAFFTGFPGDLKVARFAGGSPTTVVRDSAWATGCSWSDDGWLYYPASGGTTLMRVRASGGSPELVARADSAKDELYLEWPAALPGGRALLVTVWRKRGTPDVAALDLKTKQLHVLMGGVRGFFARTGHLVVVQGDGAVVAVAFSPRKLEISGRPVPLFEGLRVPQGGRAFFALSASGTVLYDASRPVWEVVRVTRDGLATVVDPSWSGDLNGLALSPDGSRLAVTVTNAGRDEIWVKTLDKGPYTRIAAGGSRNARPAWLPDGRSVSFTSDIEAKYQLFRAPADVSGPQQLALQFANSVDEATWSRDGRWLVFRSGSGGGRRVYGVHTGTDSTPRALATADGEQYSPSISPDGRWLAYASNSSGKDEVYVQPFPNTDAGKFQVSPAGGNEPLWSNSGHELFYRNARGELVSASIDAGSAFHVGGQRVLFSARSYLTDNRNRNY